MGDNQERLNRTLNHLQLVEQQISGREPTLQERAELLDLHRRIAQLEGTSSAAVAATRPAGGASAVPEPSIGSPTERSPDQQARDGIANLLIPVPFLASGAGALVAQAGNSAGLVIAILMLLAGTVLTSIGTYRLSLHRKRHALSSGELGPSERRWSLLAALVAGAAIQPVLGGIAAAAHAVLRGF